MEGCKVGENFMAPNSNGTCTEKPELDMGKVIADVSRFEVVRAYGFLKNV